MKKTSPDHDNAATPHAHASPQWQQRLKSQSGAAYWRGLDQLAETPEFQEWVGREFGDGASELTDPVSRRHFVQIMSASLLLAGVGLTGCRRPEQKIVPFAKQPEDYVHGKPDFYATAMPTRSGAVPLLVRSNDGRPTKIEGNPEHPANALPGGRKHGATDHYAQASLLSLYDPDRAVRFAKGGRGIAREAAFDYLAQVAGSAKRNGGKGLAFLLQRNTSPSRARLVQAIRQAYPQAGWFVYEPVDFFIHQEAASVAVGKPVKPVFKLDQANVILSLDCDFIGSEEDTTRYCRDFARSRRADKPGDPMSRLYVVEPTMTLTGGNADHRLRIPAGSVLAATALLAQKLLGAQAGGIAGLQQQAAGLTEKQALWITKCAEDIQKPENKGKSVVLAGYRQPLAVHLLAWAINSALGNVGNTVVLHETPEERFGSITELRDRLAEGAVETLVIAGGNPVYDAPSDLDWTNLQRKAKTILRWGYYEDDETGPVCDYHFPAAHYLESWGDARAYDGSIVPIQPLIAPLFGGITELEFLARLGGFDRTNPYEIAQETLKGFIGNANLEETWKKFLHDGYLPNSAPTPVQGQVNMAAIGQKLKLASTPPPSAQQLEVLFCRDYSLDDGRWNNNGWLQELPDPITKISWENAILVSPQTARDLGILSKDIKESSRIGGQVVRITLGQRTIEGPAWIQPGQADNVIVLPLGYGRQRTGRIGRESGFNAYALRTSNALHIASGANVTVTPKMVELTCTQSHGLQEGRPMVREANVAQYGHHPEFAKGLDWEEVPDARPLYQNPLDRAKSDRHQWAMSIDLQACVGCQACMVACQSENNVPIVGKMMVGKSREMHWLRIDRYYAGPMEDPQVVNQPMLCQHCESAPCENVCPVNATVHDSEGLNLMVYNRCVGTRYCSNNCPWKVRRFNFFDYTRRPLGKDLYKSPMTSTTDGEWELARWYKNPERGSRPEDEWELIKLIKNPDVTVRMRGVMEKCTFCVQRIEQAKIARKVKAGASGDVQVPDGTFTTACAQACPTEAIVFGNLLDPKSRVAQLKKHPRDYATLEFLQTRPRVTYLGKVRNPNPEMPDAYAMPLSMERYAEMHGNPFEEHKAGEVAPRFGHEPEKGAR